MTNIRYSLSLSPKYTDLIVKIKTNTLYRNDRNN